MGASPIAAAIAGMVCACVNAFWESVKPSYCTDWRHLPNWRSLGIGKCFIGIPARSGREAETAGHRARRAVGEGEAE